jgi:hypothetical protein
MLNFKCQQGYQNFLEYTLLVFLNLEGLGKLFKLESVINNDTSCYLKNRLSIPPTFSKPFLPTRNAGRHPLICPIMTITGQG